MIRPSLIALFLASFSLMLSSCDDAPSVTPEDVVVIDGTPYKVVKIGDQTWTTTNYAGTGGVPYDAANSKPEYGKYYLKSELANISLPAGWRIPTVDDFKKLASHHGFEVPSKSVHSDAVKKLSASTHWNNAPGTNESGFSALPGGYGFGAVAPLDGDIAEFWTQEGYSFSIQEAGENLTSQRVTLYQSDNSPDYRFNVRFVKE